MRLFLALIFLVSSCSVYAECTINDLVNACSQIVNSKREGKTVDIKSNIQKLYLADTDKKCTDKIKNTEIFITNKIDQMDKTKWCNPKIDSEDMNKNKLWYEVENVYNEVSSLYSNNSYTVTYEKNNKVFFRGSAHMSGLQESEKTTTNNNLIAELKEKKPATIIIEKSDEDLHCGYLDMLSKKEAEMLTQEESSTAAWYAINNGIKLKGGEPLYQDFKTIIIEKNYAPLFKFKCLAQKKGETPSKTWKESFDKCTTDITSMNNDVYGDKILNSTEEEFNTWFNERLNASPTPKPLPYIVTTQTRTTAPSSAKDIFESPYYKFNAEPEKNMTANSLAYLNSMSGKTKNYCLVKNIIEAQKNGTTFVVYGGGHLFETYENLVNKLCANKETCPSPKLTKK